MTNRSLSLNKGDCGAAVMSDRIALASAIAARTKPRFIEISREPGGGEGALHRGTANGYGGLAAEKYRPYLIRKFGK